MGLLLTLPFAWCDAAPISIPPINAASPGIPFHRGVRGHAVHAKPISWNIQHGSPEALTVSAGSSIRGVAGGLSAEGYDWRTRNERPEDTTLDYLRYARDFDADLVLTTNMRGLTAPDPASGPGKRKFSDTSIAAVTQLAADWVRYTNSIAQSYEAGDVITNPQDQAILNSLAWNSSTPGDVHSTLPLPGETVPKVKYWEIGNEPRIGLTNSNSISNSYTFLTPDHTRTSDHNFDYAERYGSMTAAMKQVDPTIMVGPCLQGGPIATERELLNSILMRHSNGQYLPVDFISYHPYQKMNELSAPADIETHLKGIFTSQKQYYDDFRMLISAAGRKVNSVKFIASEINVSNWTVNETPQEAQMVHALGSVETVFSLALLGVEAAHYWIYSTHQLEGTRYPVHLAYEGLRDHMGDRLLSATFDGSSRLYATLDSETKEIAIWGLNFSNSIEASYHLSLANLEQAGSYTLTSQTLRAIAGPTSYFSTNLASSMPGGPTDEVGWITKDLTGADLSNYMLSLAPATMTVLFLTPLPIPGDFDANNRVDAVDLAIWNNGFGKLEAGRSEGDANGDTRVDGSDFLAWQRNISSTPMAASVPEATTLMLGTIAAICFAGRRHQSRWRWGRSPIVRQPCGHRFAPKNRPPPRHCGRERAGVNREH